MDAPFSREKVDQVIAALADKLKGDWLLIGGALVALWLDPRRTTEDIDLVSVGAGANRMDLLGAAAELGLPVEAVNSAADFFVERILGWRDEIELFRTGTSGRIFRPSPTLLLLLKVPRLSEQDLEDCLAVVTRARKDGLPLDFARVLGTLEGLAHAESALQTRRDLLRSVLEAST